jgi:hypothetical protein
MKNHVAALAVTLMTISQVQAAARLDEGHARAKATTILMGDPYGSTPAEVAANIQEVQLLTDGKTQACGATNKAVWQFHIVGAAPVNNPGTPIDGYLVLDAKNGKLVCANLPMLD